MSRGRPKIENPKSYTARIRVTPGELEAWKQKAKQDGLPVSEWVRIRCGGGRSEAVTEPPKVSRPPVPNLPGLVRGSDIPSPKPKQSFVVGTDRLGKPEMVPAKEPQSSCINCNHFEGDRTGEPITLGNKYGWLCKECR